MKSTGEAMGLAENFGQAFAKAQMAVGSYLPKKGTLHGLILKFLL